MYVSYSYNTRFYCKMKLIKRTIVLKYEYNVVEQPAYYLQFTCVYLRYHETAVVNSY